MSGASTFPSNSTAQDRRSFSSNSSHEVEYKGAGVGWGSGRGKLDYNVNAVRDTRSQPFVDSFRQLRISESSQLPRPRGGAPFWLSQNGLTYESNNASYYQGSLSGTRPYGWGRGTSNANSWRIVSTNSSLRPQGHGAKPHQRKDQNRW